MVIHGFQKLTLLDYPGKVACTLFSGGCNFRCPFCQNGNLVQHPEWVDYEFRTTLCKELHGREEIEAIGKWLSGAKRYFLQNYRESDYVIDPRFSGYAREQLERFCEILRGKIETVEIRGVD